MVRGPARCRWYVFARHNFAQRRAERTAGVVTEPIDQRECKTCGTTFRYVGHARLGIYCRPACRRLAFELRRAEQALRFPTDPPAAVRETAGRVTMVPDQDGTISSTVTEPEEWVTLLRQLTVQLANPATPVARESYRLRRVLAQALDQLDIAHLGGSDQPP